MVSGCALADLPVLLEFEVRSSGSRADVEEVEWARRCLKESETVTVKDEAEDAETEEESRNAWLLCLL